MMSTHRTRIKICGITRVEDAVAAIEAGADALGFVFAPSPRHVTVEQAAAVARAVPPPVARIGVFVDANEDEVAEAVRACHLSAVQYCGNETPAQCSAAPAPVIKTLSVRSGFDWEFATRYKDHVAALLLDTYKPGIAGGTGESFDWTSATDRPSWVRLFAAGGLTPENVGDAVRVMRPFAVDVSSGVESAPGIKDQEKLRAFVAAVRAADEEG